MSLAWVKGKLDQGKFVEHRYQEGNDTAINSTLVDHANSKGNR